MRRVPVVLASIRGIAALISGLDVFPRVLPAVIIPGGFLGAFGLLVYVIDFVGLRVPPLRDVASWMTAEPSVVVKTEAVSASPSEIGSCRRFPNRQRVGVAPLVSVHARRQPGFGSCPRSPRSRSPSAVKVTCPGTGTKVVACRRRVEVPYWSRSSKLEILA